LPGALTYPTDQGRSVCRVATEASTRSCTATASRYSRHDVHGGDAGRLGWIAGHQIAEAIIDGANETDRVSLWTINAPEHTKNISKDFQLPKG
jgi:hypothetical protein